MIYDDYVSLVDFLNDRLRHFKNPWYTWAINITWDKLFRWGALLGWEPTGR
jgi:hypothetical protein